ncbi:MAG TPA: ABC transporter permease [Flavobacteriales bacterium]|nr:ABC transporter permease [Flavobacteriales bacterium]
MLIKLAWRNIWRNKRRTYITMGVMFFSVLLAILMRSMQNGVYDEMINNVAGYYTGQIQIHQKGYWEEQTLDNALQLNDTLYNVLENQLPNQYTERIETFVLAASNSTTKGAMLVGVNPENENQLTHIEEKLIEGNYLTPEDNAALIGEGLAKKLKLSVHDTLVFIGQGYHGVNAAGKFAVKGIVKFGSPELNNQLIYIPLKSAQEILGMPNLVTTIAVFTDYKKAEEIKASLNTSLLTDKYEIMTWKEMMPELVEMIALDSAGGILMIAVLYLIVAFVFLGTLIMMISERLHEFGVLIAIGMKKRKLALMVYLETISVALLGVMLGVVGASPVIAYFYYNPIRFTGEVAKTYENYGFEPVLKVSTDPMIFINQGIIIYILASVLAVYPILKILKLKAIEAMRS